MDPSDLLQAAKDLLNTNDRKKPKQANLHRATSTAYYAMFHTLARTGADLLVGGNGSERSKPAWKQVYRALGHGTTKKACKSDVLKKFPQEIQDFAYMLMEMQTKRLAADYDPLHRSHKSTVMLEIEGVEAAIKDFKKAPVKDRRAFAALVLFRDHSEAR